MLRVLDVAKSYGDVDVLTKVNFSLSRGERAGLGVAEGEPGPRVGILGGGQTTRLGLGRLLLARPDLLLLDEPTNHLDITALHWLQDFVGRYDGAVLIVSHDRAFLDALVTKI